MTKDFKVNIEEVENLLKWGREDIASAKDDLRDNHLRSAISRSYYAAFDLTKALLLTYGIIAKTHGGLVNQFGELIVREKIMPIKSGKWLKVALEKRQKADYDSSLEFDFQQTKDLVRDAEVFVDEMSKIVKQRLYK